MNTLTVREAIAQTGIEVLEHLDREVQIPLIVGPQAQGDVLVIPTPASSVATTAVPRVGVAVVRGEVGGNTHTLLAETGPVFFDPATIDQHNAAIRDYNHKDATRQTILAACGLPDDGSISPTAVELNNLDDWATFHKEVLS